MDYRAVIDRGEQLREVYPELQALFPSASALAKALHLVLSPLEAGDAEQRADELRQLWRSQNTATDSNQRRRLVAAKKAARAKYLEIAETNKQEKRWCYGGQLSRQQRGILWLHVHKLRSLPYPASWEVCELMTGYTTKGAKDGYERWKAKQSIDSLTKWSQDAEATYQSDWVLIDDEARDELSLGSTARTTDEGDEKEGDENERSTYWNAPPDESDAPDKWVSGDEYPYPNAYKSTVLNYMRTEEGAAFEKRIIRLEDEAEMLQRLADTNRVKLRIRWSHRSWEMDASENYPPTSDSAFKHVKSLREGHLNCLKRQVNEARDKLRPTISDVDKVITFGGGAVADSRPYRPSKQQLIHTQYASPKRRREKESSTPRKAPRTIVTATPSVAAVTAAPSTPTATAAP